MLNPLVSLTAFEAEYPKVSTEKVLYMLKKTLLFPLLST